MPTTQSFDTGATNRITGSYDTANVGASGTTVLTTITVPDGITLALTQAAATFTGTSLLSQARGFVLREQSSGTVLARAAGDQSAPPPRAEGLLYENTSGGDVVIELAGFHGDSVSHDMTGYQTWREISTK